MKECKKDRETKMRVEWKRRTNTRCDATEKLVVWYCLFRFVWLKGVEGVVGWWDATKRRAANQKSKETNADEWNEWTEWTTTVRHTDGRASE